MMNAYYDNKTVISQVSYPLNTIPELSFLLLCLMYCGIGEAVKM